MINRNVKHDEGMFGAGGDGDIPWRESPDLNARRHCFCHASCAATWDLDQEVWLSLFLQIFKEKPLDSHRGQHCQESLNIGTFFIESWVKRSPSFTVAGITQCLFWSSLRWNLSVSPSVFLEAEGVLVGVTTGTLLRDDGRTQENLRCCTLLEMRDKP